MPSLQPATPIDRLDLVWIDEEAVKKISLKITPQTEGDTPAQSLRDRHRDVADIDLGAMYKLALDVADCRQWCTDEKMVEGASQNDPAKRRRPKFSRYEQCNREIQSEIESE